MFPRLSPWAKDLRAPQAGLSSKTRKTRDTSKFPIELLNGAASTTRFSAAASVRRAGEKPTRQKLTPIPEAITTYLYYYHAASLAW